MNINVTLYLTLTYDLDLGTKKKKKKKKNHVKYESSHVKSYHFPFKSYGEYQSFCGQTQPDKQSNGQRGQKLYTPIYRCGSMKINI